MSGSLASIKRRRAGVQSTTPTPAPTPVSNSVASPTPNGAAPNVQRRVSIPQMLNIMEGRLQKVETALIGVKSPDEASLTNIVVSNGSDPESSKTISLTEYMSDMDKKFFMLAEEITNMKDTVLKLQTFTMDVNKILYDERISVLSDYESTLKIDEEQSNDGEQSKIIEQPKNIEQLVEAKSVPTVVVPTAVVPSRNAVPPPAGFVQLHASSGKQSKYAKNVATAK